MRRDGLDDGIIASISVEFVDVRRDDILAVRLVYAPGEATGETANLRVVNQFYRSIIYSIFPI